ncbi:DUF7344 domain-containing protein [Halorubrum lipolyticum]|uniref:DUF7344 domain-containing protein n=1 Tax=Halorubrum lipolyticum DSM 21995 TaxID=1227482 RepID=M0NNH9_9EURY|nr:hypothetical protein [Halorubrum lipolyticum]EMA59351.1 hypothetical protein C469_12001 [Halorubrum lipolyticum DSM 21995]
MSAGNSGSLSGDQLGTEPETSSDDVSNLEEIGKSSRSNGSALEKGEIFDLLKNSRRRSIIQYLRAHDGYAELNDVAEHIAADENDITVRELSSDQRKRVYIGLYQCHLPKMDTLGVVEYDKNRGTIELQDSVSQLLAYMDPVDEDETEETAPDREWLAPAIAAAVVAVVGLGTLGIGALSAVPAAGWTLLCVVGILAIVGVQYLE